MPARFCTECGAALPEGAKFCPGCGTRVAPAAPAAAPSPPDGAADPDAPTFVQPIETPPVPPELAARYADARAALRGDRREVVVLFADLSGYTTLSESMDPEEVSILMHRLLGELASVIHKYEGYVDKYIGDAVMALFGAPIAHENDAERAVLAALEMLDVVERGNVGGRDLAIRVGLNLGEVVAAQIGAESRLQYTAMGDVVNVASRLEGRAETNSVLVSEPVHRRIAGRFETEEREPLELKGRKERVRAWRVLGYRESADPDPAGGAGTSGFVGRKEELARLAEVLEQVRSGEGAALVIEAEAGNGKSRLVSEALDRAGAGVRVVRTCFTPFPTPGSMPLEADLLRTLGADAATATDAPDDPLAARRERWGRIARALAEAAVAGPTLLLLEDVHWADETSRELVEFLLPEARESGVGVLATARPPAGPPLEDFPTLALGPLGDADARALLGDRWDELAPRVRKDLLRLSEGNPLYLEELARAVAEAGSGAEVPGTLQALIRSRVDRLAAPVQRLLQMAAILGHRFPEGLLARMWALEAQPVAFADGLVKLEAAGFLDPPDDDQRRFHHALAQEVAYRGILKGVRRVLHESAARIGEEFFGETAARAEAPFFALHWWEAEQPDRAAPWLWAAGSDAAAAFDLATAETWLERAVEAIERAPGAIDDTATLAELHETAGTVFLQRGRMDEAEARYQALETLEGEGCAARGLELRGRVAWYRGRLDEARALFEEAHARLPADTGRIAADIHNDLGTVFLYAGDEAASREHHERALAIREELGDTVGMAKSLSNLGNLDVDLGDDLERAEALYRRALALAEEARDRTMQGTLLVNLSNALEERGRWAEAIEGYERAVLVAEEIGWTFMRLLSLLNIARCATSIGDLGRALRLLEGPLLKDADRVLEAANRVNLRSQAYEAYNRALMDERAAERLADGRRVAEEAGSEEVMDVITLDEGRLLAARGDWAGAEARFAEAAERAAALDHAVVETTARAHRARAAARAGLPPPHEPPAYEGPRAPLAALLAYLAADTAATRSPGADAARALEAAGEAASALGDPGLERSAFERAAETWEALAKPDAAEAARARAAAATMRIADSLPEDLRAEFLSRTD